MSSLKYMSETGMPEEQPVITENRDRPGYVFKNGTIECPFVKKGVCRLLGTQCLFLREKEELGVERSAHGSLYSEPCSAIYAWFDPAKRWRGRGIVNK